MNQPLPTNSPLTINTWIWLIVLSVLWGGSFFFSAIALREFHPFTIVFGRVTVAAIALNAYIYLQGQQIPGHRWGEFLVMGALNNLIPFCLIVWGQTHIHSSLASILNATTPIFTVLLAHWFTRDERLTVNRLVGTLVGFGGVVVLVGADIGHGLSLQNLGQVAVLGAALSYSFAGLYGRRFKGLAPAVSAAGMVTSTALMMLPITMIVDHPWTANPTALTWGAVLALGLLCTAIAYLLYFHILAIAGATNLLLVTFLIPISALLLGVGILGERLEWNALVGMGLIFTGLGAIDGRMWLKKHS